MRIESGSLIIVCSGRFALAFDEACFIGNDFGRVTLVTVIIGPRSGLQGTADADRAAFSEVSCNEFCGRSPSDDIDEVALGLFTLGISAGNANGERAYTDTGGRLFQLGIRGHVADQNYFVKACH